MEQVDYPSGRIREEENETDEKVDTDSENSDKGG